MHSHYDKFVLQCFIGILFYFFACKFSLLHKISNSFVLVICRKEVSIKAKVMFYDTWAYLQLCGKHCLLLCLVSNSLNITRLYSLYHFKLSDAVKNELCYFLIVLYVIVYIYVSFCFPMNLMIMRSFKFL